MCVGDAISSLYDSLYCLFVSGRPVPVPYEDAVSQGTLNGGVVKGDQVML